MTQALARSPGRRLVPLGAFAAALALGGLVGPRAGADDWPQWRGPNRDARVSDFKAPATWPKELKQKWKVTVGDGVATPALVGEKLYVFAREGDSEVTRCLDAASGKEVWAEKYDTAFSGKGDRGFPGPRSSPAVAGGKVVTLGVNGTLSCLDAAAGKKLWRIDKTGVVPIFHTSSSPMIVGELVVVQFGGEKAGGVAAHELAGGKEKWKWNEEGTAYASPVLMTVSGTKMVVAETSASVVGIDLEGGKTLWKVPFVGPGRLDYNASTPIVEGDTVYISGVNRGTKAIKVEKQGDAFTAKELWSAPKEYGAKFNTPVLKNGVLHGMSDRDVLFALNAKTGKAGWSEQLKSRGGYGSIVDVGPVLLALTPPGQLIVYEPNETEFKELARYKVADGSTYAYPVVSGNRVFVKDKDAVTLWLIE